MKYSYFPLGFFQSTINFKKMFTNKNILNIPLMFFIVFLLNAIFLMPSTVFLSRTQYFPIEKFYPKSFKLMDDDIANEIAKLDVESSKMVIIREVTPKNYSIEKVIFSNSVEKTKSAATSIIYNKNLLVLKEKGLSNLIVRLPQKFNLKKDIKKQIENLWLQQNRLLIILAGSALLSFLFLIVHLFLIFGGTFLLLLMNKGKNYRKLRFKSALNYLLNCITFPTIFSAIVGMMHYDIVVMFVIQSGGLAVNLLISTYKTWAKD